MKKMENTKRNPIIQSSKLPNLFLILYLILALSLVGCGNQTKSDSESKESLTTTEAVTEAQSEQATEAKIEPKTYDDPAMNYLLAFDSMGARIAGTPTEKAAADYIEKELSSFGYTVTRDPFDYSGSSMHSENVIAEKKGTGTGTVIVGAHYDSVNASKGTDDNASGVSVVLRVAQSLSKLDTVHTIKFVFFGAEEVGLEGSSYYSSKMTAEELKDTVLMVNLDSLIAGDIAYVYGNPNEQGKYRDYVLEMAKSSGLTLTTQEGKNPEFPKGTTGPFSDHASFETLGVSFIYFESTNWDMGEKDGYIQSSPENGAGGDFWHTEYDNFEDIEKTFPGRPEERLNTISTLLEKLLILNLLEI